MALWCGWACGGFCAANKLLVSKMIDWGLAWIGQKFEIKSSTVGQFSLNDQDQIGGLVTRICWSITQG
jgi:hypothetical protein